MAKYIFLFFLLTFTSCSETIHTKTYDLVDSYSELESDPLRIAMKKKIQDFLCIAEYCSDETLNKYVLNGRYLTINVKSGDEKRIEKLLQVTLCKQEPLTRCKECDININDSIRLNK